MNRLKIGTISEGTLRPEDLIPKFLDALKTVDPDKAAKLREHGQADLYPEAFLEDLVENILNDYVPPYCYFGANHGDGACFGVWPDIDALQMDSHGKGADVLKLNAGDEWPDVNGYEYVMVVTDHGNVTLFNAKTRKEEWAIV